MDILSRLFRLGDGEYADFQAKLTPTIERDRFIGVRVPVLRKFAKEILKNGEGQVFIDNFPHFYYDENMLHSLLLSEIKDYNECIRRIEDFLPYIDNWAVCDILSPKVFKKHREKLIDKIMLWSESKECYICRFGLGMLMNHYLDDDFRAGYLEIPATVKSDEYYVNMMLAWLFATALAKQWGSTITYIEERKLPVWVHNKTIQKSCESFRITPEQKTYLRTLKIKKL